MNDAGYCHKCYYSVVCLCSSVTLLEPFDGMRCRLTGYGGWASTAASCRHNEITGLGSFVVFRFFFL